MRNTLRNQARLIGRLGKDPELRHTVSGTVVASFTMATSEIIKRKDEEPKEDVQWHNIVAWRQAAVLAEKYLKKGDEVAISGKIVTDSWEDTDGNTRYTTKIVVDEMVFLGKAKEERQQEENGEGGKPSAETDESKEGESEKEDTKGAKKPGTKPGK